jgi:endonuclease-3
MTTSTPRTSQTSPKKPFDIDAVLARIHEAVRPYPPAAMFDLAERGYNSLFQQVVACILSTRTRDEVSLVLAQQLFERAPTAQDVAGLPEEELITLIHGSTFYRAKAPQIRAIARVAAATPNGDLPADAEALLALPGVGPKCAHLALGVATGQPWISVDIHVHRVTNRWGYVATPTPEQTMFALESRLPKRHWVEINRLLVPFGKHTCTGRAPKCSSCPVLEYCQQVGVSAPR